MAIEREREQGIERDRLHGAPTSKLAVDQREETATKRYKDEDSTTHSQYIRTRSNPSH